LNFSSRADVASLPEGSWQAIFGSEGEFENQIKLSPYQVIILKRT
jgi:hypothetical protein